MTRALSLRALLPLLALILAVGIAGTAAAEEAGLFSPCPRVADTALAEDALAVPALEQDLFAPAPESRACHWAYYDEFWKDGEICRYGDSCTRQYYGTCPNGWDYHYVEIFPCCT